MVKFAQVQASNAQLASHKGLVAVFAGATSGIGEYSVLAFARNTQGARIYILGRSQAAADRIVKQIEAYRTGASVTFLQSDLSLIKTIDATCKQIQEKESAINVLYCSQGNAQFSPLTAEGLAPIVAVGFFGRLRLIQNLLPQVEAAQGIRRVVNVLAGTKEGKVYPDDLQGKKVPFTEARGHLTSGITLSLEQLSQQSPTVSFLHTFPGFVRGNLLRGSVILNMLGNFALFLAKTFNAFGYVGEDECGERHVYLATSSAFPPASGEASGLQLVDGVQVCIGTDGKAGSGVYTVDEQDEPGNEKQRAVLLEHRKKDFDAKIWAGVQSEFKRITTAA